MLDDTALYNLELELDAFRQSSVNTFLFQHYLYPAKGFYGAQK